MTLEEFIKTPVVCTGRNDEQLVAEDDTLGRFDMLMESVDKQLDAYGAPEPTSDEIILA